MSRFFSLCAAAISLAVFFFAASGQPSQAQQAADPPEKAAEVVVAKTYPLDDLLDGGSAADWIKPITTLVEPKTWKQAGGLATIIAAPADQPAALIVTHNREVHAQIDDLLQRLRRVAAARKAGGNTHFGLSPAEQRIEKALQSPTELEVLETPLDELVESLKKKYKIEMRIDKEALDDALIAPDTLVTKSLNHITFGSVLRFTLHELDLTYVIKDEALQITTPEAAEKMWFVRLYDIDELVTWRNTAAGKELVADPLVMLLRAVTAPLANDPPARGTLAVIPRGPARALAVNGDLIIHAQVADVLDELRYAAKKQTHVGAAEKKILNALISPTEFEFFETPLEEVVNWAKEQYKIEIQVDKRTLCDVGVDCDSLITMSVKGVSLRSALRKMLRELDLTYVIIDDVLLITGTDIPEERALVKTYPVDDLLTPAKPGQPQLDAKGLKEVIVKTIAPKTWERTGVIVPYRLPNASVLVVRQTFEVHEEIVALLGALRRAAGQKAAHPKPKPGQTLFDPEAAEEKIAAALKAPAECEFFETPLEEVVNYLKENHKIEILFDKKALDDVGIEIDTPVTKGLHRVTLRRALEEVLGDLKLTYVVADEVLQITTPEAAATGSYTAAYPIGPATEAWLTGGTKNSSDDKVVRKIVTSVAQESWQKEGGAAAISVLSLGGRKVLVIRQSYPVHAQLADTLGSRGIRDEDRAVLVERPAPRPEPPDSDGIFR